MLKILKTLLVLVTLCSPSLVWGQFTKGNLIVEQVGNGTTTLGSAAFTISLVETNSSGSVNQTITNQFSSTNLLTESGSATSNGQFNSYGSYIAIPGYNSTLGTTNVAASNTKATNILDSTTNVINRIVFPTSGTPLPFTVNNFRSIIPTSNTTFYASGTSTGTPTTGGIWYFDGTNYTQISTTITNTRNVEIHNGNLYFSTGSGTQGIYQIGSGLPTNSGQTATLIAATTSPYGFSISPDAQIMYIADDGTVSGNTGGGIQKWTFNGSAWSRQYTFGTAARGLTVDYSGTNPIIYATTTESSANKLIKIIDAGSSSTPSTLVTAAANYAFRGVDFSPAAAPSAPSIGTVTQPTCATSTGSVELTGLPSGQWRIYGSPTGSATGTGSSTTISGLSAGTYTFIVTSYTGRTSSASSSVTLTAPIYPSAPVATSTQIFCPNATVNNLSATGNTIQWYTASSGGTLLSNSTVLTNNNHYYATQTINGCESTTRTDVTVQLQNQWTGATSNDWSTASNWSCGIVPSASEDAIIPSTGITNVPTLSVNTAIKNISVGSTVVLNGKALTINGAISGSATITGSANSGLIITGTAGTINMTNATATDNMLNTLSINSGASATVGANGIKIVPGGTVTANGTLTLSGNLRLQSDANATARIAQSAGTISGNVTQERFVPGKAVRKWSFLASPVSQSLASAWQQQIHITGPGTGGTMCNNYTISGTMTPHSNGFDVTQLQNPSFYTYDAATDNFVANTSGTNTFTLSPGNGYMVLVRGDRNDATNGGCVLLSANNQAAFTSIPVTLAATGTVGQGTITKVLPAGYSFIGNPYPCEMDFPSFNTTNASVISGGYWTYYPTNATYTFSTYNNGTSTNGGTQVIANGQSFLVNSTSGGTITFNEAHKSTTANNGGFRLHTTWDELLRVGLLNNQSNRLDEVVIRFGNDAAITKSINEYDAASVNGGDQWIKTMKDATELAIQTRPNTYQNDTVALAIHAKNAGTYQLGFSEYQGLSNTEVYLIDQQENLIQNVKALPSYDFSVAANTTTANRFKLIFDAKTSGVGNIASNTQLQVYPNPTKDKVSITCNSLEYGAYQIKVRTITGAEVLQAKGFYKNGDVIELSLNDLAAGMYLLELSQDNGFRATQKITKH